MVLSRAMSTRTISLVLQRLVNKTATSSSSSSSASFSTSSQIMLQAAAQQAAAASSAVPPPTLDGQPKEYSAKIQTLVDEISKLNLIEVSDLNELLRKRLNIRDVPMAVGFASQAAGAGGAAAGAKKAEEEKEEETPKATKSSFRVKLMKFDDAKKVALIKEIKSLVENMNLVQAKKFVESAPQVLKNDVTKDDAEKLKAQLEKVGATVEIE